MISVMDQSFLITTDVIAVYVVLLIRHSGSHFSKIPRVIRVRELWNIDLDSRKK